MIIILREGATEADASTILEQIRALGLKPLYLPGEEKIVLGAIGDERILEQLQLASRPEVERVVPILKPYKLAGREHKHDSTVINHGKCQFGGTKVMMIAGPCSVESEEQILGVARQLKELGVDCLRGGAYKPRTSPYDFQGLEERGLELLALARQETGLPIVTEVLSEYDIEKVAKVADILQVGARNMQNFKLLSALGACHQPVILKRGQVASIKDLLLAAEYILSAGNPNVILCERGIKSFFSDTRNTLDLSVVPLLKRETHLPVIVDPSHGTGVRELVLPMSLAAIACGADGLMVEVHPCPEKALSDGFQQLTPAQFGELVAQSRRVALAVEREIC